VPVCRLSEKEDYGAFIEGNLRQLLSRDIMYHPVKQICDRFPEWLAVQEDTLPREEYIRYSP
jgi:peroxin-19